MDMLHVTYGVEEEELMKAVVSLGIQKDPEVLKMLEDNLKSLPPDVMQRIAEEVMGGSHQHEHGFEQHPGI